MPRKGATQPKAAGNAKPNAAKAPMGKSPSASGRQQQSVRPSNATPRAGMARTGSRNSQPPPRRTSGQYQQQRASTGFGNRDLTLLIGGVMVVVFAVIAVLLFMNRSTPSSNTAATTSTNTDTASSLNTPAVILEPQVAATLTTAAGNPEVQAAQTALYSHTNITPVPTGQLAPDFTLPGTDEKTYTLSDYRGKSPVVLEFMAPWCPHCQNDAKFLNEVYEAFKGKNLQMFAVSAHPYGRDWQQNEGNPARSSPITMADLTWFRDTFGVQYPLLLDKAVKAADLYGIEYFPTIYVLDKDGKISSQIQSEQANPITTARIKAAVEQVVKD